MTPQAALTAMRDAAPLVHCITNYVAMNVAANVLLSAGASPAMIHADEEVADFVPIAGALTINIGTVSAPWASAMQNAALAARQSGRPWVLDPVAHFATPYRARVAQDLLAIGPTIVRGNASEIMALAGETGAGKGADSGDAVESATEAAARLAKSHGCVVAVTGARDFATDGTRHALIDGGSALMPKVTALGCSLTGLVGGYAAVADPLDAVIAALVHFAEAGERAEAGAQGPGSFAVRFIDQLAAVAPEDLNKGRVTWG